jgi:cytochrome c oxidase subunit 1
MFGIGGLTGLPLGFNFTDLHLHDSYYVIAHFHYVVAPGSIFALFAGIYYWFPKMTGRRMSEYWGKVHFWGSLIFMNIIFMPMFIQGFAGMSRRMSDGGATYSMINNPDVTSGALTDQVMNMNSLITMGAFGMGLVQVVFIVNFFWSIRNGEETHSDNPWKSTTLEWQTPTPPPHGNFPKQPKAYHGPYEYSNPDVDNGEDFMAQNDPQKSVSEEQKEAEA